MSGETCNGAGWCVKRDAAPPGEPFCDGAGRCVKGFAPTPAARPGDELREVTRKMANVLVMQMGIRFEDAWPLAVEQALHAEDYAERQARERAADALLWAAWTVAHSPGIQHQAKAVNEIRERAETLATDRTKP